LLVFVAFTSVFALLIVPFLSDIPPTREEVSQCFDNLVPQENRDSAVYMSAIMDLCRDNLTVTGMERAQFWGGSLTAVIFIFFLVKEFSNFPKVSNAPKVSKVPKGVSNKGVQEELAPTGFYVKGYVSHNCTFKDELDQFVVDEWNQIYSNKISGDENADILYEKIRPKLESLCRKFCVDTYETQKQFFRVIILRDYLIALRDKKEVTKTDIGKAITKLKNMNASDKGFLLSKEVLDSANWMLGKLDELYDVSDPVFIKRKAILEKFLGELA
jgi:hypothetical protein